MKIRNLALSSLLCLSVWTGLNAQNVAPSFVRQNAAPAQSVASAPTKAVAEGEVVLGYCPDEISSKASIIGLSGQAASVAAAIRIPSTKMAGMVGGQITKIRVGAKAGVNRVYVWIRPSLSEPAVVLEKLGDTVDGWNELTLANPYEITGDEIYIGFSGQMTAACEGLYFDGETHEDACWLSLNSTWGNYADQNWGSLCIQAVAQATLPDCDLAIGNLTYEKTFYNTEEKLDFTARIFNQGKTDLTGYVVSYGIDGQTLKEETVNAVLQAGESEEFSGSVDLSDLTEATYQVKVSVRPAEESVTDEVEANNTISGSFSIFLTSYDKKVLIEQFTTINCPNCPAGSAVLNQMASTRDNLVWVAHHVGYGTDELTLTASNTVMNNFQVGGAPFALLDRTYISAEGAVAVGIGYTSTSYGAGIVGTYVDYCASFPAFASVDVTGNYNPETRELTVDVTGEKNNLFDTYYDAANLTVYLIENGIVANQPQSGYSGQSSYVHNHVLRATLTPIMGQAVTWDGNTYSYHTTTTLDEAWVAGRMGIVAFLNKPYASNYAEAQVINANQVMVNDPTYSSIESAEAQGLSVRAYEGTVVVDGTYDRMEIFAADGRLMRNGTLTEGLYVVRVVAGTQSRVAKVWVDR
ncbi:MAG: Omp28-related outer membrane protein [Bacteroidaceae bacterium]